MKFLLTLSSFFCLAYYVNAQDAHFIQNKGQWNEKVKFSVNNGSSNIFLLSKGYKVSINSASDLKTIAEHLGRHQPDKERRNNKKLLLRSHAYEVNFVNANPLAEVITGEASATYSNYLSGNDQSKWQFNCKSFSTVTFKNIYPGIDVRYFMNDHQFKYDLIVNPGADVTKILLEFKGTSGISKFGNDLLIKTSLGNLSELKPYTYQVTPGGEIEVATDFVVEGSRVYFNVNDYDKSKPLIIDPVLTFSTFSGSTADNWGYSSAYDAQGNFYLAGTVFGTGFPVNNGAMQHDFAGGFIDNGISGFDIGIIKFDPTGSNRIYATYLGGSGNEEPHNLWVNKSGELVIAGSTNSSDFPVTLSPYGTAGARDIFIAKLDAAGQTLIASRKIGGSGDDAVNIKTKEQLSGATATNRAYGDDCRSEVITDNSDNIYFGASTQSVNFPVTNNAFQKALSGFQDGIVVKLSSNLDSVYFSSFLGGSGDDAVFSIALSPLNNHLYVAGATTSNNLLTTGNNAGPILYKSFRGGTTDGYIAEIANDGSTIMNMSYVGSRQDDMVYFLALDKAGYPYVTGTATEAFPVINAGYKTGANGKQFITKFSPSLNQVIYSTNFGTGRSYPDIVPTAFGLDNCQNVYISGWGGGLNLSGYYSANTTGLAVTSNAIRSNTDGSDAYVFVLEKNAGSQLYGTFFGNYVANGFDDIGDHTEGGNSRFDSNGNLYLAICGNCLKTGTFPTTAGAWSTTNQATTGAECSMTATKINMNLQTCVLPVKIGVFTGVYKNEQSLLQWKTLQEINSNYFEIEHSVDAQNFNSIGKVNASGNSNVVKDYSFAHRNPGIGLHYYRLKLHDKDETAVNSNIVTVVAGNEGLVVTLFPNPAHSSITLNYPPLVKETFVNILSSKGEIVTRVLLAAGSQQKETDIRSLSSGSYFIQFQNNGKIENIPFIKQ
ncbi:T9SS type A sorting domain-containing protein [Panacibacter sp. DH6]|uniref:T9SS type A sorting domain-containing protein n=1 Tax=Panacibacter microcysteis TaxID=2793269 RepID=A0A931E5R5_9BACT|nr:T9SS type A sorting domain-containing protein [Panacibacter microcysteis]MBG9376011.1 T9SS type A sorting domain-containing protein [Panacibacter microcysteis]